MLHFGKGLRIQGGERATIAKNKKSLKAKRKNNLKAQHKDTLFRGIFKIPTHFLHLLETCKGKKLSLTESDIKPFDLESAVAIRTRRNDVSFITNEGNLIILVEHQSTINPNMALRLFLYYNELLQLWIKQNDINIFSRKKLENLPIPEFYVAYNGSEKQKEDNSIFKIEHESIKIDITVKIVNIHFDSLEDTTTTNAVAGYAYFYKNYETNVANGLTKPQAFEQARLKCIEEGYLTSFIEKEDFIMFYKDFLDYDKQLETEALERAEDRGVERGLERGLAKGLEKGLEKGRAEGLGEGMEKGMEKSISLAIQSNMPYTFIETLAKNANISEERLNELLKSEKVAV